MADAQTNNALAQSVPRGLRMVLQRRLRQRFPEATMQEIAERWATLESTLTIISQIISEHPRAEWQERVRVGFERMSALHDVDETLNALLVELLAGAFDLVAAGVELHPQD
jgi:hypothetical protein